MGQDAHITQLMFENIFLNELIKIIVQYPNKREQLCEIFYCFCSHDSQSRLHLIKKIKALLTTDLRNYISILSTLITFPHDPQDFDEDLFN